MSRQKILKSEIRHEEGLGNSFKVIDFFQTYSRHLMIGAGVVVALVVAVFLVQSGQTATNDAAGAPLALAIRDMEANQLDSAAQKLNDIVARYGGSKTGNRARLYLADVEIRRGNNVQAEKLFDDFIARTSASDYFRAGALRGKAVALENQSKFAEAAAIFETAAAGGMGDEEKARTLLDAARARTLAGDRPAALKLYERIVADFPTSRAVATARMHKAELTAAG